MIFQSPNILWALSLLAIPIIIHLFQFKRYKQLLFPDISLLKEVQNKSQIKNQLKHILVLLTRLAFISLIVLAFAQPIIPAKDSNVNKQQISIYIDNSFSMQNAGENGKLFSQAIQNAFQITENYPTGTEFQLITNELAPSQRHFLDLDGFTRLLDQIEPSAKSASAQRVINFHKTTLEEYGNESGILYLISDFNQILGDNLHADSNQWLRIMALNAIEEQNLSIDSVWVDSPILMPGIQEDLHVRITNHGTELRTEVPVELFLSNKLNSSILINIESGATIDTSFSIMIVETGFISGLVSIDDHPIDYDNNYFFEMPIKNSLKVSEITGEDGLSNPFKKIFKAENQAHFQNMPFSNIIYDSCASADFLILNELETYSSGLFALIDSKLNAGSNVLMILPRKLASTQTNELFEKLGLELLGTDTSAKTATQINLNDPLYRNIFEKTPDKSLNLPQIGFNWNLKANQTFENVLGFATGYPLLAVDRTKGGHLFICTAPLSVKQNQFAKHALFVPSVFNAAILSGLSLKMSYEVSDQKIELPSSIKADRLLMIGPDSSEFIPTLTYDGLFIGDQIKVDGEYVLKNELSEIAKFAFNYQRSESETKSIDITDIRAQFDANGINHSIIESDPKLISNQISEADLGHELWYWAAAMALLFVILESILIKRFNQ